MAKKKVKRKKGTKKSNSVEKISQLIVYTVIIIFALVIVYMTLRWNEFSYRTNFLYWGIASLGLILMGGGIVFYSTIIQTKEDKKRLIEGVIFLLSVTILFMTFLSQYQSTDIEREIFEKSILPQVYTLPYKCPQTISENQVSSTCATILNLGVLPTKVSIFVELSNPKCQRVDQDYPDEDWHDKCKSPLMAIGGRENKVNDYSYCFKLDKFSKNKTVSYVVGLEQTFDGKISPQVIKSCTYKKSKDSIGLTNWVLNNEAT